MFTADVALEGQDEIAQDPSSALGNSQRNICRVVDCRINTSAPAVGLSFVLPKTTKTTVNIVWYHMQVSCCTNLKNAENMPRVVLVLALTAKTILLRRKAS